MTAMEISGHSGESFDSAAEFALDDAMQRRLRYHLLRLTALGLARAEIDELVELGRLAFQEADLTDQVTTIKQRAGVTSLAFAIADIVERGGRFRAGRPGSVMLGAVLGAYAALSPLSEEDMSAMAVHGAIGGAIAMSTATLVLDNIDREGLDAYLRTED